MAKILLLEDSEPLLRQFCKILEQDGHSVITSQDGAIAYDQKTLTAVDVMITDLMMPQVSGIEAILQAKKVRPELKIIAISAGGMVTDDDYLSACLELGAAAVLQKPFEPDTLIGTLRSLLDSDGREAVA
jgi:DNA-binding response OmpR family regulator